MVVLPLLPPLVAVLDATAFAVGNVVAVTATASVDACAERGELVRREIQVRIGPWPPAPLAGISGVLGVQITGLGGPMRDVRAAPAFAQPPGGGRLGLGRVVVAAGRRTAAAGAAPSRSGLAAAPLDGDGHGCGGHRGRRLDGAPFPAERHGVLMLLPFGAFPLCFCARRSWFESDSLVFKLREETVISVVAGLVDEQVLPVE